MEKQHLEFLRLKFYDRTQVLNDRLPKLVNKNYPRGIHVELEFIILEFLIRTSSSFAFSRSCFSYHVFKSVFSRSFFFYLQIWFFRLSSSSCIFQIDSSDRLQIVLLLPLNLVLWFFRLSLDLYAFSRSVLQIVFGSSDHLHLHLRSSDTSIELEFHVDKFLHLSTRILVLEARFCH